MTVKRFAAVVGVALLAASVQAVPAHADGSYFCLSVSTFPPIGQPYEVSGLLCHGSGTTDVTIAGGGSLGTHLCRTATLTNTSLRGTDCRHA